MNPLRMRFLALCAIIAMMFLAGCETTQVGLTYDSSSAKVDPAKAPGSVELLSVSDHRKHAANWLGAIRGGFGNPLKTLETSVPVKDLVGRAYEDGLRARGLLAPGTAKYSMKVDVNQFDCNQYARREAHIRFNVTVVALASGQSVYENEIAVDKVTGSAITLDAGIFASVDDLRKVANEALQEAVDKTLNDQKLLSKIL
jgi:uncharacterized lipoprotein YajG